MAAIAQVCDPQVFGQIDPKNITDCTKCTDELRSIAVIKNNMILMGFYANQIYHRRHLFTEVVTEEGICYSFNAIKVHRDENTVRNGSWTLEKGYASPLMEIYPFRPSGVGTINSLNFLLMLCTSDFDYICRKSAQGFKVRNLMSV
jgi:Amiloride-sensitive sodium channel